MMNKNHPKKKKLDWDSIKKQYEGDTPVRDIAKAQGCAISTIRQKAKIEGWTKRVPQPTKRPKITDKDSIFIERYLQHFNGARAVEEAGFDTLQPQQYAYELLSKLHIHKDIQKRIEERKSIIQADSFQLIEDICVIAFCDPRRAFGEGSDCIPPRELPDDVAKAIAGIEVRETETKSGDIFRTYKYKFWDKQKAQAQIAKHLGVNLDGSGDGHSAVIDAVLEAAEQVDPGLRVHFYIAFQRVIAGKLGQK